MKKLIEKIRGKVRAWIRPGGLVVDLVQEIKQFNSELEGPWSLTLTPGKDPANVEANLLKVGLQRPAWRGPGFRRPSKNAPAQASIELKFAFNAPPCLLIYWLQQTRAGIIKAVENETKQKIEGEAGRVKS